MNHELAAAGDVDGVEVGHGVEQPRQQLHPLALRHRQGLPVIGRSQYARLLRSRPTDSLDKYFYTYLINIFKMLTNYSPNGKFKIWQMLIRDSTEDR